MADFNGGPDPDFHFFGTEEDDVIRGNGGDDFLGGAGGNDLIKGGAGDDSLQGGGGDDVVRGGAGNDSIAGDFGFGTPGADVLTGGAGDDTFEWRIDNTSSIFATRDLVTDFEGAGGTGGDTLELNLPFGDDNRLVFEGELATAPTIGTALASGGNGFTEVFYAFSGGDTLVLADSNDNGVFDTDDFAVSLAGRQALIQSDFGATDFVIPGTNEADTISGTPESDTIFALDGNDFVEGGAGNDSIFGGNGHDHLRGDAGRDLINGGTGADTLSGGDDGDFLSGDEGNDLVDGGSGDDNVAGGDGNDLVIGGEGDDNVDGDDGHDVLSGGAGEDNMVGGDGNDIFYGQADNDFLQGGDGDDSMFGGGGNDEIVGYAGRDINVGGGGNDTFGFFLGTFSPSSTLARSDIVLDFEGAGVAGGDFIDLNSERVAFGGGVDVDPQAGAVLPGAGDGVTQLVYTHRDGDTWLLADENDNGQLDATDFTVRFEGLHDFTQGDFVGTTFVTVGTAGDDVITGTARDDIVFGAAGNDQIFGLGGDDELSGGDGNDSLDGGPGGFDSLTGDAGDDTLTLATSDNGGSASGGAGRDALFGSDVKFAFSDLRGDGGNDTLQAGAWGASLDGGNGADRLISGRRDDQLVGGRDADFLLDGDRDLFGYGAQAWGNDTVSGFEDGVDKFDLRGSGLAFADLEITNSDFQTTIASDKGVITLFENFDEPVVITAADFLF